MLNTVKSKFFIAAIVSITTFSTSVFAQQIAEDHMAAARKALSATKATESFDGILIQSSAQLKNQLTANSPDKADEISSIVDHSYLIQDGQVTLGGTVSELLANERARMTYFGEDFRL